MSAQPAFDEDDDKLSPFETAFIRAALEHRGILGVPSEAEFRAALDTLRRYDERSAGQPQRFAWEPDLADDFLGELRAKAFLLFDTVKPTAAQWHRAHTALFGPLLCATCE